jgi:hypothetical protein
MVWGFCYLRIFKKMHSINGRSLPLKADVFAVFIEKYRFLTLIIYALLLIPPSTIIHNDIFFIE